MMHVVCYEKNAKPKKEGSYLSWKIFDTKEEGVNDLGTVRQVFFTDVTFNAVIDSEYFMTCVWYIDIRSTNSLGLSKDKYYRDFVIECPF